MSEKTQALVDRDDYLKLQLKVHELEKQLSKCKQDEKKAFWWSAEFTHTVHDRNIQSAWVDYLFNKTIRCE